MNDTEKEEIVVAAIQWMAAVPVGRRLDIEHYVDAVLLERENRKGDTQRAMEHLEARLKEGLR